MLYDYCTDYIEKFTTYYDPAVNKIIYNLCCEYIMGSITDKQRNILTSFFKIN